MSENMKLIPIGSYDAVIERMSPRISKNGKVGYVQILFVTNRGDIFDYIITYADSRAGADYGIRRLTALCNAVGIDIAAVVKDQDIGVFLNKRLTIKIDIDTSWHVVGSITRNIVVDCTIPFKYESQTS